MTVTEIERVKRQLPVFPPHESYVDTPSGREDWCVETKKAAELPQCTWCQEEGHSAIVRLTPRPDLNRLDVLDELVESCPCCAFGEVGHPERGLLARLRGEQAEGDDHDIAVEVMSPEGRWLA